MPLNLINYSNQCKIYFINIYKIVFYQVKSNNCIILLTQILILILKNSLFSYSKIEQKLILLRIQYLCNLSPL